jgi:enoyl-CoA hydratase
LNALSAALRAAIVETFEFIRTDAATHVDLTGAGRAFTAGLDLKELGANAKAEARRHCSSQHVTSHNRFDCGRPIIGAINGYAITGGFEMR